MGLSDRDYYREQHRNLAAQERRRLDERGEVRRYREPVPSAGPPSFKLSATLTILALVVGSIVYDMRSQNAPLTAKGLRWWFAGVVSAWTPAK